MTTPAGLLKPTGAAAGRRRRYGRSDGGGRLEEDILDRSPVLRAGLGIPQPAGQRAPYADRDLVQVARWSTSARWFGCSTTVVLLAQSALGAIKAWTSDSSGVLVQFFGQLPGTHLGSRFDVVGDTVATVPSSVTRLLTYAGLAWHSVTPWGELPKLHEPGLYLVSTSSDPGSTDGDATCRLSDKRIEELLAARPDMTVGGQLADSRALAAALTAMWPHGETVLYIGLAGTSVSNRVGQYYATPLGARAPHAGGWPIKMLADPGTLHVHVAAVDPPNGAEDAALRAFMESVSADSRAALSDPQLPLPFANLQLTNGLRMHHLIRRATAPRLQSKVRRPPTTREPPAAGRDDGLRMHGQR